MTQTSNEPVTRSPAAVRMRAHRERKKNGMRCVTIELRDTEIDALIGKHLLKAQDRTDTTAIAEAPYTYFDRELCKPIANLGNGKPAIGSPLSRPQGLTAGTLAVLPKRRCAAAQSVNPQKSPSSGCRRINWISVN
jgi:hypothetical protein